MTTIKVSVTRKDNGAKFWLRGTIWVFDEDRAQAFATIEDAQTAFTRTMKFTKPRVFAATYGHPLFEQF